MDEKIIPWWRKALNYAWGGIRSGFGLFPQTAPSVPFVEHGVFDRRETSLQVETALTKQPIRPETVPAIPKTVAAHSAAAKPVPAAPVAGVTPLTEATVAAAVKPNLAKESSSQPASRRKPAGKLLAEPVTKAEPATQAESTSAAQPVPSPAVFRPDPIYAMAPAAEYHAVEVIEPAPVPESAPRRCLPPGGSSSWRRGTATINRLSR